MEDDGQGQSNEDWSELERQLLASLGEDCFAKKKKKKVVERHLSGWDYPLSRKKFVFEPFSICDTNFHRKLDAKLHAKTCTHEISTCLCGYAASVNSCPKCHPVFCDECDSTGQLSVYCKTKHFSVVSIPLKVSSQEEKIDESILSIWIQNFKEKENMDNGFENVDSLTSADSKTGNASPRESLENRGFQSISSSSSNCTPDKEGHEIIGLTGVSEDATMNDLSQGTSSLNLNSLAGIDDSITAVNEKNGLAEELQNIEIGCKSASNDVCVQMNKAKENFEEVELNSNLMDEKENDCGVTKKSSNNDNIVHASNIMQCNTNVKAKDKSPFMRIPLKFGIGKHKSQTSAFQVSSAALKWPKLENIKQGPSVQDLIKGKGEVYITHVFSFDKLHIVSAEAFRHHLPLLNEDIYGAMKKAEGGENFPCLPDVGSVLLAPYKSHYARAVLEEIRPGGLLCIRYFDVGSRRVIRLGSVFQIAEELLNIPILGEEVFLKDVTQAETEKILFSDFTNYVKQLSDTPCFLKSVENVLGRMYVSIEVSHRRMSLSKAIADLGVWEWEKRWMREPGITESKLCKLSTWTKIDMGSQVRTLPKDSKTKVTVVESSDNAEIVCLLNVESEYYYRDRTVLWKQLEHYVTCVQDHKEFYPTLGEHLLIKIEPNDNEKLKNLRGVGKWSRCVRHENVLWNMDEYEFYPLSSEFQKFYQIRKFCFDFAKLPWFIVTCCLKDCLPMDRKNKGIFSELAKKGNVLTLSALDFEGVKVKCDEYVSRLSEWNERNVAQCAANP